MTLTKYSFPLLHSFFDDDFIRNQVFRHESAQRHLPAVNVSEDEKAYLLEVAAPGLKKEDFRIEVENKQLIVSSSRQDKKTEKDEKGVSRREFNYYGFRRAFTLPENRVDLEQIHARYENGVLQLTLPKREATNANSPRLIEVH